MLFVTRVAAIGSTEWRFACACDMKVTRDIRAAGLLMSHGSYDTFKWQRTCRQHIASALNMPLNIVEFDTYTHTHCVVCGAKVLR